MTTYILRRILGLFPVLFGITLLVFFLVRLIPGDPAVTMLGDRASVADIERVREQLGLNEPLYKQYFSFMGQLLQGDLGKSIIHKTDVTFDLRSRLPATIEMVIWAMVIGVSVGVTIGVVSAVKRNSIFDILGMIGALLGVSMPIFWLALILIYALAVNSRILPPSGRLDAAIFIDRQTGFILLDTLLAGDLYAFGNAVWHLILPSFVLSTVIMPPLVRITRACMLDVLNQDYVRTARAKGLLEQVVIIKHALKNALLPVVTVIGGQLGGLLGGAILTETIFSWPGMGTWTYQAISYRDYPIVQASVLVSATIFVFVNLIVDLIYMVLDPRVRYN
ncbi:MAG: ABC transporter permease [Anaerolineaceae bacterium]|nr:ABC transporter permease [Anaerolineaceae bacterium]